MENKPTNYYKILHFTPAIVWGVVILYFSSLEREEVPTVLLSISDKLIHSGIYFLLSTLIILGYIRYNLKGVIKRKEIGLALVYSLVLGGITELIQEYLVPSRFGDWLDFWANTIGAIAGVLILSLINKRWA